MRQRFRRVSGALQARGRRPRRVLGRMRAQPALVQAVRQNARMEFSECEMVRRRHDQCRVQLSRSASRHAATQQGRADLGGRARRLARADLPDARRRSGAMRQRAQEPWRQGRRPRRDLHADGARGGDRDARVRANRRDSFRGLRRFLVGGDGRSDQRRRSQGLSSRPTADGVAGRSSSSRRMSMKR